MINSFLTYIHIQVVYTLIFLMWLPLYLFLFHVLILVMNIFNSLNAE